VSDIRSTANERFRSNLLSIVSHELNTPLTSIINAVALLEEKYPEELEYIPMLKRNADRLRKTVENLLEISRVDAGTLRVRLSELDLQNFFFSRKSALQAQLARVNFDLVYDFEEDLPHVCGDARRLAHVFDSLVLNAAKFSHADEAKRGVIRIELRLESVGELPPGLLSTREKKTGMYLNVSVQSSLPSIGESPETFEQLFEPFTPWRDADTRVREGLGVELAIAKEILTAHEGFIWADQGDKKGKGWRFHFALPLLSRLDELDLVINNRLSTAIGSLSKLSLLLLRPEPGYSAGMAEQIETFQVLQKALFRSSDSIFWIQDTGEYAVLMDDCDTEGGERVSARLIATLQAALPHSRFLSGLVTGPESGANAQELLEKARSNWRAQP
jgi:nitrogen-specific signal transduction histidine kinase